MRFVAAYLLVKLSGRVPTKENMSVVLESVDRAEWTPRGDELLKALEGKDIDEVLASGEQLLVSAGSVAATGVQAQEADKMQEDEQEQEGDGSEDADVDIGGFMEDDY